MQPTIDMDSQDFEVLAAGNYAQNNYFEFVDTFHTPGLYTVQLVVTDQNNCKDTITRTNYGMLLNP